MPHKAPPPPHLPRPRPPAPGEARPKRPEMRADHELEDSPTMHPGHELPGRPFEPQLGAAPHRSALARAIIFGTLFTALVWVILAIADISVNVILPVVAPIWVGSCSLLYAVFRK